MAPKNGRCLSLEFMVKDGTWDRVIAERNNLWAEWEMQEKTLKTSDDPPKNLQAPIQTEK